MSLDPVCWHLQPSPEQSACASTQLQKHAEALSTTPLFSREISRVPSESNDSCVQLVIGGRNKYLINGHVAQPT